MIEPFLAQMSHQSGWHHPQDLQTQVPSLDHSPVLLPECLPLLPGSLRKHLSHNVSLWTKHPCRHNMHCGVTYATEKAVENNDFLLNNTHIYRQSNQNNLSIKKILDQDWFSAT